MKAYAVSQLESSRGLWQIPCSVQVKLKPRTELFRHLLTALSHSHRECLRRSLGHFFFFGSRALCSSRRPLKDHIYGFACDGPTTLRVYSKGARRRRILPRRGADMHASAAVVATATATVSIAVRSPALLFTAAFHCPPRSTGRRRSTLACCARPSAAGPVVNL